MKISETVVDGSRGTGHSIPEAPYKGSIMRYTSILSVPCIQLRRTKNGMFRFLNFSSEGLATPFFLGGGQRTAAEPPPPKKKAELRPLVESAARALARGRRPAVILLGGWARVAVRRVCVCSVWYRFLGSELGFCIRKPALLWEILEFPLE